MERKILVPLDGSPLAERILPYAVLLATNFTGEIILLRVLRKENRSIGELQAKSEKAKGYLERLKSALLGQWQSGNLLPQAVQVLVARSQPPLSSPQNTEEEWPYRVSTVVTSGDGVGQIIAAAEAQKVDLIAMSTHGRTGLNRLVSGSVTAGILHASRLPVLVVRPQADTEKMSLAEAFRNIPPNLLRKLIVVPLSGATLDEKALSLLTRPDAPAEAPVTLLEVVPNSEDMLYLVPMAMPGYISPDTTNLEEVEANARRYLAKLKSGPLSQRPQVNTHLLHGNPAEEILDYARKHGAGFIVMASHARTGVSRMALGSVTSDVILHSNGIPVIVVTAATRFNPENQPEFERSEDQPSPD